MTRTIDRGRKVSAKPVDPKAEKKEAVSVGQYPDGIFDIVIRVVNGRVEIYKDSAPPQPAKQQLHHELRRMRLDAIYAALPVTMLYKKFEKEIADLQEKLDRLSHKPD